MNQSDTQPKKKKLIPYLIIYVVTILLFMGVGMGIFYAAANGFCYYTENKTSGEILMKYAGKIGEVACDPDSYLDDEKWSGRMAIRSLISDHAFSVKKLGVLNLMAVEVTVFSSESGSDCALQEGIWDRIYIDDYIKGGIAYVDRDKFLESAGCDLYEEWNVPAQSTYGNQIRVDAYAQKGWECIPMKVTCVDMNGDVTATKEIYQASDIEDGWEIHEDADVYLYLAVDEVLTDTARSRKLYAADLELAESVAATIDYTNQDYQYSNNESYYSRTLLSPTSYTHIIYAVDNGYTDTNHAYGMTHVMSYHFGTLAFATALITWLSGTILYFLVLGIIAIIVSARRRKEAE